MAPGSSMPGYSCTTEQLASLRQVVGDISAVANICKGYNVTELGEQAAAIRYLAAGSSNNSVEEALSLNTLFVLLSAYLVFIMQAGFALVSGDSSAPCMQCAVQMEVAAPPCHSQSMCSRTTCS
jgi:hypothetical protein